MGDIYGVNEANMRVGRPTTPAVNQASVIKVRMAAVGGLPVDANRRCRGTQPCSVGTKVLALGTDRSRRNQKLAIEVRPAAMGRSLAATKDR